LTGGKDDSSSARYFERLNIKEELLRGIKAQGFLEASTIQQKALAHFFTGRDIIAQSLPGTGKTTALSIAVLQKIDLNELTCQAVIIAPTGAIAQNTAFMIAALGAFTAVSVRACLSGDAADPEYIQGIEKGVHILTGTPSSIIGLMTQDLVTFPDLKVLAIDDADEILLSPSKYHMKEFFPSIPSSVQRVLFSATYSYEASSIMAPITTDPVTILVNTLGIEYERQYYVELYNEDNRLELLLHLLTSSEAITKGFLVIIYCNSLERAEWLQNSLKEADDAFNILLIHNGLSTEERVQVYTSFQTKSTPTDRTILISIDRLALNVHHMLYAPLTINFDMPVLKRTYITRVGRISTVLGRKRTAINFITNDRETISNLRELERYYGAKIEEMPAGISDLFD
jgi:superfamily II DNA/RNA helicase